MSFTTSVSTQVEQFNFVKVFKKSADAQSRNSRIAPAVIREQSSKLEDFVSWINNTTLLTVVEATTLPIGKIFKNDRVVIRFQLAQGYQKYFGLLRGLFAFQHQRNVTISSVFADQGFELQLSINEVDAIKSYLEEILGSIEREISFKESLKVVIDFEQQVRKEQAKLYSALKSSSILSVA